MEGSRKKEEGPQDKRTNQQKQSSQTKDNKTVARTAAQQQNGRNNSGASNRQIAKRKTTKESQQQEPTYVGSKIEVSNPQHLWSLLFLYELGTFLWVRALSLTTLIRWFFNAEITTVSPRKMTSFLFFQIIWHKAPKENRAKEWKKSFPERYFISQRRLSIQDLLRHGMLHLVAQKNARVVEVWHSKNRWSIESGLSLQKTQQV